MLTGSELFDFKQFEMLKVLFSHNNTDSFNSTNMKVGALLTTDII